MGNQQAMGVRWAFGGGLMARGGAAATTRAPLRMAGPVVVNDAERSRLVRLVERMGTKDEAALAEFYDATVGKAYAFALRITRDAPLAEEVVADAFHQAWRDAGRYDPNRSGALTWLLMMCRSRGLDALRARDPALVHDAPETLVDEALLPSAEGPLDILQALQSRSAVHAAVATLSAAQRQMIALAFFRGLSHQEIAAHTRTPVLPENPSRTLGQNDHSCRFTLPSVRSGDAIRRYPQTRPPCPGLADARLADSVRPSLGTGEFASRDSNQDIEQQCA